MESKIFKNAKITESKTEESNIFDKANNIISNNTDTEEKQNLLSDYKEEKQENEKPKRKYTKRSKKDSEQKPESNESQKLFSDSATLSAHVGLDILIKRLPNPIPLTDYEKNSFNLAFTNFAQKYYSAVQKYGEELNLVMILGLIILPRYKSNEEKKEKVNEESNNTNIGT